MLSIVIPVYNEAENVCKICEKIRCVTYEAGIETEIVFVDDGSSDRSYELIKDLAHRDSKIRGIRFSRNFGKESAIYAGLAESTGDCAVVMDCDLQHPAEKIPQMYELWEQGYEIVEGKKNDRGSESFFHEISAIFFYKMLSRATGYSMENYSDFKLLDRKAIITLLNMPERNTFFRALSAWIGYKSCQIEYDVQERSAGKSKWGRGKLIRYAISNIVSFTSLPLQIVTFMGVGMLIGGVILSVIALYQKIAGIALDGFTTLIIFQCLSTSAIMISLGIIGYYLAKIFDEVRKRPKYVIAEKTAENDGGQ